MRPGMSYGVDPSPSWLASGSVSFYGRLMSNLSRRIILAAPLAVAVGVVGLMILALRIRAQSTGSICAFASAGCSKRWQTFTSTPTLILLATALVGAVAVAVYLRTVLRG